MAALVWVMMGIALWHFAIFVPDYFWSGIVGAFVGAVLGAVAFGLLVHGLTVPGQNDTDLLNALEAIPGAIAGMAVVYVLGRRHRPADVDRVPHDPALDQPTFDAAPSNTAASRRD
jgi:hypothetical protein